MRLRCEAGAGMAVFALRGRAKCIGNVRSTSSTSPVFQLGLGPNK